MVAVATCCRAVPRAADWNAGGGEKWDALLAAAHQEGGLVAAICPELAGPIERDFKADTGLDISFVAGGVGELSRRFGAEVQSQRITIDVHLGGASDVRLPRDRLLPVADHLVLPNVTDGSNWQGGSLRWIDSDQRYLAYPAGYVSTRPLVNRDIVSPADFSKWTDLLKPEFKGKIAAFDPTSGGPGQSTAAYMASVHGIDFVTKVFTEQDVVLSRDSRQLGEWAARGLYPIILGIDPLQVPIFHAAGVTSIVLVDPTDGPGSILGGCAAMTVPKDAPHPNAALVFANWYLSTRGQKALVEAGHYPSRRMDVPPEGVPANFIPDPAKTYLDQYQEDWYVKVRPNVQKALKEALGN